MSEKIDSERWLRISRLFDRAIDLDEAGRRELLDTECGDPDLREEIRSMLDADAASSEFDSGAAALAALNHVDAQSHPDETGTHLGPWILQHLLGHGGMGSVYMARREHDDTGQRTAIKLMHHRCDDAIQVRRFLQERRILAALSHPNVPKLIDHGIDGIGRPWFALEYIEGVSLIAWPDARHLNLRARIGLFLHVCAAVQHAHEHFIVHRDLKPTNILVDAEGHPKVLDFGVAKYIDVDDGATRAGAFAGFTPEYAAPEQISGGTITAATDVYALGAILYQLLTGQLPYRFQPDDLHDLSHAIVSRTAERMSKAVTTGTFAEVASRLGARNVNASAFKRFVRGDLTRIVQTALAKEPQRRYSSVQAFADDLTRFLEGRTVSVSGDTVVYRTRKFVGRNRWSVAIAATAVLSLLAALAFSLIQMRHANEQARTASAVRDFMVDVFAGSNPTQTGGESPSARALLDMGARKLTGNMDVSPETRTALSQALAESYAGIGSYDRASTFSRQVLEATEKQYDARSPQVIDARISYAEILRGAGRFSDAMREAGIVLRDADGRDPLPLARAHLVESAADTLSTHAPEAEAEARQALRIAATLHKDRAHWQAAAWNALGQSYLANDRYDDAQKALSQAIKAYQHAPHENPAEEINTRSNLALLLLHTGQIPQAMQMYSELIPQEASVLGPTHPQYVQTIAEYAYMLGFSGEYAKSRQMAERAREALGVATGLPPATLCGLETYLAVLAHARGDLPQTLRILDRVDRDAATIDRNDAKQQRLLLTAQWLRARVQAERGEASAVGRLDALRNQSMLAHYPVGLDSTLAWPIAWMALGHPRRAVRRYDELETQAKNPPASTYGQGIFELGKGIALVESANYADAEALLTRAIDLYRNNPQEAARAASAHLWRGWAKVRAGSARAGLDDIEDALAWLHREFGEDSYVTAEAHLARAEALAALGKKDDALREQALARNVLDVALAPTHVIRQRADGPLPQ